MKRFSCIIAALFIMMVFSACTGKGPTPRVISKNSPSAGVTQGYTGQRTSSVNYSDGTYTGHGDAGPYGNQGATITISNGRITSVSLFSVDSNNDNYYAMGNNYAGGNNDLVDTSRSMTNNPVGGSTAQGYVTNISKGNDLETRTALADTIVRYQSYDVDVPTSNLAMANNWKLAVRRALEQARK